jgi:hypothetical protein
LNWFIARGRHKFEIEGEAHLRRIPAT